MDEVVTDTRAQVLGSLPFGGNLLIIHLAELALALADGPNDLVFTATDRAGNQTIVDLLVTKTGAAIALSSPADGSEIPALRIAPVVEVLAPVTIDALYSGALRVPGFEGGTLSTGVVTLPPIPLVPGANEIRIVYRRAGGPPEVTRFAFESTATDAMTVTGVVRDGATGTAVGGALVSITVNGLTVVAVTGTDGSYAVKTEAGNATVVAMAEGYSTENTAGSGGTGDTVVADLDLDDTGIPGLVNELAIVVPPAGTVTDFEQLTVVGTVLNPLSTVSVNGIAAEVVGHRFTARHVPLAMGANTISVTASALGAPPTTTSVTVERATEPVLAVKIFSPPAGATIPGGGLVVRGFVSASDARTTTNLGLVAAADGVFELTDVVMPVGSGEITATSRTRDGVQEATDEISVSVLSTESALVMVADPTSGVAPLSSTVSALVGVPTPLSIIALRSDLDGDGFADPVESLEGNVATFEDTGVFFPRTEIVTPEGVELGATGRVEVHLASESLRTFAAGNPVDLAPAPDGDLWVLDAGLQRIRRFTRDGGFVSEFGSGGTGSSQLSAPQGIAVSRDGRLYVADTGNHRIQVFESDGTWVRSIGTRGSGALQFESPRAVLVDGGRLFVSDAGNDRVQVLTLEPLALDISFPLAEPRRLLPRGIGSVLVASPSTGVRLMAGDQVTSIPALDRLPDQGQPESPVAIGIGSDAVYIGDAGRASVIVLGADLDYRRVIDGLDRPPLSVLGGARSEQETVYIADGTRVIELSVPTESPRATYDDFVARMAAGDIPGALVHIHPERRAHYEQVFALIADQLPQQAALLATAELVELRETRAVFHVERTEIYQGNSVVNTYPVVMSRQRGGAWRIWVY